MNYATSRPFDQQRRHSKYKRHVTMSIFSPGLCVFDARQFCRCSLNCHWDCPLLASKWTSGKKLKIEFQQLNKNTMVTDWDICFAGERKHCELASFKRVEYIQWIIINIFVSLAQSSGTVPGIFAHWRENGVRRKRFIENYSSMLIIMFSK